MKNHVSIVTLKHERLSSISFGLLKAGYKSVADIIWLNVLLVFMFVMIASVAKPSSFEGGMVLERKCVYLPSLCSQKIQVSKAHILFLYD